MSPRLSVFLNNVLFMVEDIAVSYGGGNSVTFDPKAFLFTMYVML